MGGRHGLAGARDWQRVWLQALPEFLSITSIDLVSSYCREHL